MIFRLRFDVHSEVSPLDSIKTWVEATVEAVLPWGSPGLFLIAFAESSFFPLPPDAILIPLALYQPSLALWYAAVTTAGSVLGAFLGYFLGNRLGRLVLRRLTTDAQIERIDRMFRCYGGWAVGVAGFTPIPYKVFTIAAGVFRQNLLTFTVASVISRGARFFLEALLIMRYGEPIIQFLSSYFELLTFGLTGMAVLGYLAFRRFRCQAS